MNRKYLVILTILIQLTIIIVLFIKIDKEKNHILGEMIINPINKRYVQSNDESTLSTFYELISNTTLAEKKFNYSGEYRFNKDGLNERFDYTQEKPLETFRILTLGDSFTFGLFVDTHTNYPEQLETLLNANQDCRSNYKFEVINLGVPGYDIEFAIERFKIRGHKYKPDLVIFLLKGDDLLQVNELIQPLTQKYHIEKIDSPWKKAYQEFKDTMNSEEIMNYQIKQLNHFENIYQGKILYALLKNTATTTIETQINTLLQNRSNDRIHFKVLSNIYTNKKYYIEGDRHPNVSGYGLISSDIFQYLQDNRLILCN